MSCNSPGSLLHHLNNLLVGLRHPNDVSSFTILVRAEVARFSSRCLYSGVVLDGKVRASQSRLSLGISCSGPANVSCFEVTALASRRSAPFLHQL